MMKIFILGALFFVACTADTAIPTEFPTPPPPASATPLPRVEYRRDGELEKRFAAIAQDAKGKVGVAAVILETGDAAFLNEQGQYPMQSVYKLPISMAVRDQVRQGKLELDEKIGVTKDDMVRPGQASVIRDKNPNGGEFTIRELIRLALVESDGTASDVLMRVAGGPDEVQAYLTRIGVPDIKVVNTEKEFAKDWQLQFQNYAKPIAAVELLAFLFDRGAVHPPAAEAADADLNLLLGDMNDSKPGARRLRGLLPVATILPHKTGTSGSREGVTAATNDIGIIYLPNGKHLAIAVFVSESPADEKAREAVIARIAKAAWDRWGR